MSKFARTALATAFVFALSLGAAFAQDDDVVIVDPMEEEGFDDPVVMESEEECEWECGDEGLDESASYDSYFEIANNSSQEICTLAIYTEEEDAPWEFYVGTDSGCLQSGDSIQVDYSISSESCEVYIELLDGADEINASGPVNYCENVSITIH